MKPLKKKLTPEQYNICFLKGTEPPGSEKYNEAPSSLRSRYLLRLLRRGRNPAEAENSSYSFMGLRTRFSTKADKHFEPGTYHCVVCDTSLFASSTKYDSHSGWPAFWEAAKPGVIKLTEDTSLGMNRTEVTCAKCGSHLGHVFEDGPAPTGKRYCINSLALEFRPKSATLKK